MKRIAIMTTVLMFWAIAANAQGVRIGNAVESFSLPDLDGRMQTLGQLKGRNGTVVIFLSAQCPVVKAYKDRINQTAAEAGAKGINFIGINSNSTESLRWVKANASAFGFSFPILIDRNNILADKLDARTTPDVFFIDRENVLLYHGAIGRFVGGKPLMNFMTSNGG